MKPILGITMGDAAGIGPELILKAFQSARAVRDMQAARDRQPRRHGVLPRPCWLAACLSRRVSHPSRPSSSRARWMCSTSGSSTSPAPHRGVVAAEPGNAAVVYTKEAGRLAMEGAIEAIVSAPLNKEAMRLAGYAYEGQTEILGELTGSKRYGMILILGSLRVMMLTTHMALRKACDAVTKEKVLAMIELANQTLRTFGIAKPRIAVAGLNPHAGEGGLFGTEELTGSRPAVEEAVRRGIDAVGPVPADVVFVKARERRVRPGARHVPRPGQHGGQAPGIRRGDDGAGRAADHPHLGRSRHGFRHRGQEHRASEQNFVRAVAAAAELATLKRGG